MTTGKTIALTRWTFVDKVMSLLFSMLTSLIIAFLPRSKHLLISWLQTPSTVIWDPDKIKSVTVSTVSPSVCHEVKGLDGMILVFWMLSFKPTFSLSSFTFIKRLFSFRIIDLNKGRTESSHMPYTQFPLLTSYITWVTLITVNDVFFPIPSLLTHQCLLYLKWFLINQKYLAIFNLPWQSSSN